MVTPKTIRSIPASSVSAGMQVLNPYDGLWATVQIADRLPGQMRFLIGGNSLCEALTVESSRLMTARGG